MGGITITIVACGRIIGKPIDMEKDELEIEKHNWNSSCVILMGRVNQTSLRLTVKESGE